MEVFTWDNFTPSFHFLPTVQSFSQELITETVNHVVEFTLKDKITYLEKLFSEWKISTVKDVEKTMFQKFNNISNLEKCSEFKQFVISQVQTQLTNWNMVWNEVQKEINLFSSKQKEDMIRSDSKISNIRNEINNLKNEYSKVYNKNIHSKSDLEAIKDELEKLSFKIDKQEKDMISKNFDHKKDFNTLQQDVSKITQKISYFDSQFLQVDKLLSEVRKLQPKMDEMKTKIQTFDDFNQTLEDLTALKIDVGKIQKQIDNLNHAIKSNPSSNFSNQILELRSSIGTIKNDNLLEFDEVKEEVETIKLDAKTLQDQLTKLNSSFNDQFLSLEKMIETKIQMHMELAKQDLIQFEDSKIEDWKKLFEKNQFELWRKFRQEIDTKYDQFVDDLNKNNQQILDFSDLFEENNENLSNWKVELEGQFATKWEKCQTEISQYITDIDKKLSSFENRISTLEQMCDDLRKDIINQEFKINDSNYLRFVDGSIYIGDVELNDKSAIVTKIANIYSNNVPVVDSPMMVMCDNKGQLGTNFSSIVYKENVDNIGELSRMIYKLRPVSFTYKTDENKNLQYGLIGEEVEKVSPELVCYNKEDNIIGVAYHKLIPLMVNEMKAMKKELDSLKMKMN